MSPSIVFSRPSGLRPPSPPLTQMIAGYFRSTYGTLKPLLKLLTAYRSLLTVFSAALAASKNSCAPQKIFL